MGVLARCLSCKFGDLACPSFSISSLQLLNKSPPEQQTPSLSQLVLVYSGL
jgi:hypothetical protein